MSWAYRSDFTRTPIPTPERMAELKQKLRVAIIGGGVGGLTCAIALKDCRWLEVDLYESASILTEIGAGITLWHRTWTILKNLGLEKDFLEITDEKPRDEPGPVFMFRLGDSASGFDLCELMSTGQKRVLSLITLSNET